MRILCDSSKAFECATVFMSMEKYIRISAVPQLVKGLLNSTQSAAFESAPVLAFQLNATEQLATAMEEGTFFLRQGTKHSDPLHSP